MSLRNWPDCVQHLSSIFCFLPLYLKRTACLISRQAYDLKHCANNYFDQNISCLVATNKATQCIVHSDIYIPQTPLKFNNKKEHHEQQQLFTAYSEFVQLAQGRKRLCKYLISLPIINFSSSDAWLRAEVEFIIISASICHWCKASSEQAQFSPVGSSFF